MGKKILISPAHYIIDPESGNEYHYPAKIIKGLALHNKENLYFVLCGYCHNKKNFPANIKFFEFFKTGRFNHNLKTRVFFYFWLLYKSTSLCLANHFHYFWHMMPNGLYSLNPFILFNFHRLFGIKKTVVGMLLHSDDSTNNVKDYNLVYNQGVLSSSPKKHIFAYKIIWFFLGFFNRKYFNKFDILIFCNSAALNYYEDSLGYYFDKNKIKIIPSGFDEKKVIFKQKNLANKYNFLFIGSLINRKRLDIALRLCSCLKEKKIDFFFDIIGEGHLKKDLLSLTEKLHLTNNVKFHGFVPYNQILSYYHKAHFLFLFSDQEGLTQVSLEAMATGTLFIGSDIFAGLGAIKSGENGYLFKVQNNPDYLRMAEAVMNINNEKYQKLTNQAYLDSKEYHWDNIIKKYHNAIFS